MCCCCCCCCCICATVAVVTLVAADDDGICVDCVDRPHLDDIDDNDEADMEVVIAFRNVDGNVPDIEDDGGTRDIRGKSYPFGIRNR